MKSKELLLAAFMGLMLLGTSVSVAQTKANYQSSNLIEIGPANLGGRVKAIIADRSVASQNTFFAGAAIGGLYEYTTLNGKWNFVPCYLSDGSQLTLPITTLAQASDYTIYIGTGEAGYVEGNNTGAMAARGRGIWKMDHATREFTQLIDPAANPDFKHINELVIYEDANTERQYAATETGLFTTTNNWATSTKVFDGAVKDIEIVPSRNVLYFTERGAIYRISNAAEASAPVCMSTNDPVFATNGGVIKIAVAPSDPTYLYAMVFDTAGTFAGVYLTRNQQTWSLLNTSTVNPFSSLRTGENCGTIIVDLGNPKRIYVGGETIWAAEGFVENSYYQWTTCSYSEASLNSGNYMSTVYNNVTAVHSGIHTMLPIYYPEVGLTNYYIGTDGGVYLAPTQGGNLQIFTNMSLGLNAVQVSDFAICPDGSVIMGANAFASPFVESRMEHNGGNTNNSWYDNSTRMNHNANVLFTGNGGQAAASMFQKYGPTTHRGIFVSANGGKFARSYNDYSDYTNTQTWTEGESFVSDLVAAGYEMPKMILWETNNNTTINDSVNIVIDSLGTIIRNGEEMQLGDGFEIKAGDKMTIAHPAHFGYPFEYTFTEDRTLSPATINMKVFSPLHGRIFLNAKKSGGRNSTLMMNWTPTDYRRVWSAENVSNFDVNMAWASIVETSAQRGFDIRQAAVSNDADAVYAAVSNANDTTYFIIRVRGLNSIDLSNTADARNYYFNFYGGERRQTIVDTISYNSSISFNRPITSMTFDPREGKDRLIITFGGDDNSEANVLLVDNATSDSYTITPKSVLNGTIPAYSAMVEYTTGEVYIGTEDGVFLATASSFDATPAWQTYGDFAGVPVLAMHQQIKSLPIARVNTHNGINLEQNVFAKTKYPFAMYFGTYGRGVFMDMSHVTDTENEIVEPADYEGINTAKVGNNSIRMYPNPTAVSTTLDMSISEAGNATVKIYDMSGRIVYTENYGTLEAGRHTRTINCQSFRNGIYVVNMTCGNASVTSKLVVK